MAARLSKSKLMAARQCPRRLWLEVNRPNLASISTDTQAAFATGHLVGEIARDLYGAGNGHLLEYDRGLGEALRQTRRLLADRHDGEPIFEATLEHDGLLVRLDVLLRTEGGLRLIEVKSSTSIKDEHLSDCAIQAWVARGAGVDWEQVLLAHVDNTFVYCGDGDYRGLLLEYDVTADVEALQPAVPGWLADARHALAGEEPDVRPGKRCVTPHACPFMDHCWPSEPAYPVQGLGGDRERLGEFLAAGFRDLRDVPAELLTREDQKRIWRVTRSGAAELAPAAGEFVRGLAYPRHFLDFETFAAAVPVFVGTRPYETIPFQFSCHVQQRDGEITHRSFLDLTGRDPRRACAEALIAALGSVGPVLTYTGYEKRVIEGLVAQNPDLAAPLLSIVARLVDLHPVTRQNFCHPDLLGSWSLKAVLPVIAPDLSYAALGKIRDGNAASAAYGEALAAATSPQRRAAIRADLERYCALDTEGLVRLTDYLARDGRLAQVPGDPATGRD